MTPAVAARLRALNRQFYQSLADPFAATRLRPQPGFNDLLPHLPPAPEPLRVLDVGCGNGRFGHFLQQHTAIAYTGLDFTPELLTKAQEWLPNGRFLQGDMTEPGFLDGLGVFDLVVCLAAMQHVPGHAQRQALLGEMGAHLAENGRLFLSNWQFMDSARQRRKVRPWSEIGLRDADVEPQDYLLTWQRDGFGLRYVCLVDEGETAVLAAAAGLEIVTQFRRDGKEGNLNLYTVLAR